MIDPHDLKQIRLYADGELSPDHTAEFERRLLADPGLRQSVEAQVQLERNLKSRVNDALTAVAAPAALREQVQRSLAEAPRPSVLARLFVGPQRANVLAVAATLALIAGAILFSIFARTIDDVGLSAEASVVSRFAVSLDQEHGRCAGDQKQFVYRTPDQAASELSQLLSSNVRIPDLQAAGYEFCGAGACDASLPGSVLAHLLYRKMLPADAPADARRPMISVFIMPNTGVCCDFAKGLPPMKWEPVKSEQCRRTILRSSDCKLIYFMVCCSKRDVPAAVQTASIQTFAP